MASRNPKTALLIIDMLNKLEFPEWRGLLRGARPVARNIARLKERAHRARVPVLYVNDNFGQWHSDWRALYRDCADSRGGELARLLPPRDDDYFVLKPKHSGFYESCLGTLLGELKVKRLILTGIAGNICVLFTAHDAHMRGFEVRVTGKSAGLPL